MSQTTTNPVPTLKALMEHANAQYRIFDLGRRIQSISKSEFDKIENNQKPYPYPIQQRARFAVVFWQKNEGDQQNQVGKKNPFIWFLQFDLDEVGLLKLQQRDHYIGMVIKELGSQLLENGQKNEGQLDNHPYSFTPDQHRLATFNAKVKLELKQPASMYYEHAQAYFKQAIETDKWQELAIQGIADFCVRINEEENADALASILPDLPVQIMSSIAATLEHVEVPVKLSDSLANQLELFLDQGDKEQVINTLRCLSGSVNKPLVQKQLQLLLESGEREDEALYIVIAGRLWPYLAKKELLHLFFEQVSQHGNAGLFAGLFADLVAVPELRQQLLTMLRDPQRPKAISVAMDRVFRA